MNRLLEYISLTIGSLIVAVGIELILAPNSLVDGGVTAIAIMMNHLFGTPIFIIFLALNMLILLFTAKDVGKPFVIRTMYANIVTTIGLIWLTPFPAITDSDVLIVLYGGLLVGLGIGIVVKFGGAIDGTEMLAVWFHNHFKIPISTFLLAINAVIFTFAAFIFSIEQAMFSLAIFYIVTKMIDFVLDGLNQGKSIMIISDKSEEIGEHLMSNLKLSITYLQAVGGYSNERRLIIYCITNRFTYPRVKETVLKMDPSAVIEAAYVSETSNVKKTSYLPFSKD
ncbi:YitT family protein [Bacillus sp. FJAT-47783]|uniref:YitT family protein n=1 Tax=Bacillus sp. FJAT-47783 TaxID=2922712 RepID=UPI001FADA465